MVKNLPAIKEMWGRSLGEKDPLEKEMATRSSILAWRIYGQRSLVGYSPQGCEEQDTTEATQHKENEVGTLTIKIFYKII